MANSSTEKKARKWHKRREYLRRVNQTDNTTNEDHIIDSINVTRALDYPSSPSTVKLHICTFNSGGTVPQDEDLDKLLPSDKTAFDIFVIGVCEFGMALEKALVNAKSLKLLSHAWTKDILERIGAHNFALTACRQLQGLLLVIFTRREMPFRVTAVKTDTVATGIGNVVGNKGAVIVKLITNDRPSAHGDSSPSSRDIANRTSMTFVLCHLCAHQHNARKRTQDYERIVTNTILLKHLLKPNVVEEGRNKHRPSHHHSTKHKRQTGILKRFKRLYKKREKGHLCHNEGPVFLFGDLNFRVQCANRAYCDRLLAMGRFDELLNRRCQLTRQLANSDDSDDSNLSEWSNEAVVNDNSRAPLWNEWTEAPVLFPPTYKFDVGTNTYDTSAKQRIPSWTDRILWRSDADAHHHRVVCHLYDSIPAVKSSDHRPVFARFTVNFEPAEISGLSDT